MTGAFIVLFSILICCIDADKKSSNTRSRTSRRLCNHKCDCKKYKKNWRRMNILLPPVAQSHIIVKTDLWRLCSIHPSMYLCIYVYISSTNLDNCGCQNPTTFFSCEWDDDDDDNDTSIFLKTIVVIFSFDNPVAYLTNVSNNETDIVWLYVRMHSFAHRELK